MTMNESLEYKEKVYKRISEKYPDFDKEWNEFVNGIGSKIVSSIKMAFKKQLTSFENIFSASLSIVVDNNFIFGNIKNAINRNCHIDESFISKLAKSEFIKFYAPPKLKEELYAKIEKYLSDSKELAISYADNLLNHITIKDAAWVEEWQRANNLIGHIDVDDVPYLALAFNIGSHSIVSYDKVFKKQNDVQIWDQKELGKVMTSYNSGTIAFMLMGLSAITIVQVIKFVILILKLLFDAIIALVSNLIRLLSFIPLPVWLAGGALLAIAYNTSNEIKELFDDVKEDSNEWIKKQKVELGKVIQEITTLLEVFKNENNQKFKTGFDFLSFLLLQFSSLNDDIKNIELNRAKSN